MFFSILSKSTKRTKYPYSTTTTREKSRGWVMCDREGQVRSRSDTENDRRCSSGGRLEDCQVPPRGHGIQQRDREMLTETVGDHAEGARPTSLAHLRNLQPPYHYRGSFNPISEAILSQNSAISTSLMLSPSGLCVVHSTVTLLYRFDHSGWCR